MHQFSQVSLNKANDVPPTHPTRWQSKGWRSRLATEIIWLTHTHLVNVYMHTGACKQSNSLEPSVVVLRWESGRQHLWKKINALNHGQVKGTERWPPLVQHLLSTLEGKVAESRRKWDKIYIHWLKIIALQEGKACLYTMHTTDTVFLFSSIGTPGSIIAYLLIHLQRKQSLPYIHTNCHCWYHLQRSDTRLCTLYFQHRQIFQLSVI